MSQWRRAFSVLLLLVMAALGATASAADADQARPGLSLADLLERVLNYNEDLQIKMIEVEVTRRKFKAERGIFEPQFTASAETLINKRTNNVQQIFTLSTTNFNERNNLYNGGLEFLAPSGGKLRIEYTLRELHNNLQRQRNFTVTNGEWESFAGFSVEQPLLKNAGRDASLINIRLAAVSSDIAFQDYRKQLMILISRAEAAYWDLYLTQEQERLSHESVGLANTILSDNRERARVGKSSQLDVLESEAGLALRKTRLADAAQKRYEAATRLASLYAGSALETNGLVQATDQPQTGPASADYLDSWQQAFDLNPDYQIQRKQIMMEGVRVAYARNQRLPQVDLKANYGFNGLGTDPSSSMQVLQTQDFPSWTVGVEMHVPLGGGIKARNELVAAKLKQKEAVLALHSLESQITTALDSSIHKVGYALENITNNESVINFSQNVLTTQMERLRVGQTNSEAVLRAEEDLFQARLTALDAMVQYQKARLELGLVKGSVLKERHLDLTQAELVARTTALLNKGRITDRQYLDVVRDVKWDYERGSTSQPIDPAEQEKALKILREKIEELEQQKK